uniref:Interleukin-17F n=1 Tax=Sphenodon punctatus TaxID=8508 RepID=A0A8D0L4N5_SPHPU
MPFCACFRSLLLFLILGSIHGKAVRPGFNTGEGSEEKANIGCLFQKNSTFPLSVKVDISIIGANHAFKVVHDVSNRSTSPWDYRYYEDPNRFPQVIAEAKCRHYSCVASTGQEDYNLNSVPIRQEILVLRREQKGCQQTYRLEKKLVTVGCTCAMPIIRYLF